MNNDPYDLEFDALVGSVPVKCALCGHNWADIGSNYCKDCEKDFEGEMDDPAV